MAHKTARRERPFGTTLAYVRWFDSAIWHSDVQTDDLDGPKEMESAGFLVKEDKESVTIALDRGIDTKNLRLVLCIPRANIRAFQKIEV